MAVSTTNTAVVASVAEHTVGLMLGSLRSIPESHRRLREGDWRPIVGDTLSGKTVGILGFGRIGSRVASHVSGLGCEVLTYDPMLSEIAKNPATAPFTRVLDLMELLSRSDLVSIHVPLSKQTVNMIGLREMQLIGSSGHLINTSRGGVINEVDLNEALCTGQLGGAALDVFSREPYEGPLLTAPRLIMTPHIGTQTRSARRNMHIEAVGHILRDLQVPLS